MKHTTTIKKWLAVAVLVCTVNGFAQPLIGQGNTDLLSRALVDSSQHIADRIIGAKTPVLVDFWAAWCGPCLLLDPVMDTLKREYKGRVLFIKVNVDVHREISGYFRVQGIPAVFIVADSMMQDRLVGLHPRGTYKKALDSVLKKWNAKNGTEKSTAKAGGAKT